jgi:hypothetical protein
LVLGIIVGVIAVRGAIGARIACIVAAVGIVVAIAVRWIFGVPDAPPEVQRNASIGLEPL